MKLALLGRRLPLTATSLKSPPHGCATHMLQGGADIRHIQKILGHASVETTAIYTKVAPTDLARAVARAHPREQAYNRRRRKP